MKLNEFFFLIPLVSVLLYAPWHSSSSPHELVLSFKAAETPHSKPQEAQKFDEYGNLRFNDERARLDNFVLQLQQQEGSIAYIIGYDSESCRLRGEAGTRLRRARSYMVNARGVEKSQIVLIEGGRRDDLTFSLYVVRPGDKVPLSAPTLPACAPRRGK